MPGLSIAERFRAVAAARRDQPAIRPLEGPVSYGELDRASDRVAAYLAQHALSPGDRVALYCPNSAEFAAAYLGIVKAGAVVVPINLLLNPREIAYIAGDAGARALIYHEALGANVGAFRGQVSGLELAICIGRQPAKRSDRLWAEVQACVGDAPRPDAARPADLAAILYTSGTTGRPKGAMLSHRNLVSNTDSVFAALRLDPVSDRILVVLPMFHSFAATVGMLMPLLNGLSFVPVPRFDPALVSEAIAASRATVFLGVPSMYGVLLRIQDAQLRQWASIRFGVSGGAAMPVEVMRRFEERFGFPILEGDGPTECSPVTCVNPPDGTRKPASVGPAIPGVEIGIFDDAGACLETGAIGEVCVRGPNVMQGYWGLPEATAEAFFGEWLRTGDLGTIDGDGYVFLVDRKKDMIIVNGMNVYPRMIEEVLYRLPGVGEAAVVGEPHESHGEIPVAYVVSAAGASLDAGTVRAWCKESLGRHEVPRKVIFVGSLPKNAAGKILKRELRRAGELERGVDSRQLGD
jgi:long-chain acyl-CoA synthetase